MSGAALHADFKGLEKMAAAISRFEALDRRKLLDVLGATAVSQTQRRIQEDKASPEGVAWKPWSQRYAKTRHANQSLLIGTGALVSGLTHNVISDHEVEWGSPEIYARRQQEGDGDKDSGIPARPFLGVSDADGNELEAVSAGFIERTAGELQ